MRAYLQPNYQVYILKTKKVSQKSSHHILIDVHGDEPKNIEYIRQECNDNCYCKKFFIESYKHIHIIRKENIKTDILGKFIRDLTDETSTQYIYNTDVVLFHPDM